MSKPVIAVVSFPGNNCEVETIRAINRHGMIARFFRWNDDREKLQDVDGYFIPGGFAYEDRGRAGMVPARDPLMRFIAREAEEGKIVIGNCNGAQVLVESGLIPLDGTLRMSLAKNTTVRNGITKAAGFLNEWVYITPTCAKDRCIASNWEGVMRIPIAHGEGRFTTKDPDLLSKLRENDQIAFCYCDAQGHVSDDPSITPNGSMQGIAGICNPAGNVVALMPHPERTVAGDPYFISIRQWIEKRGPSAKASLAAAKDTRVDLPEKSIQGIEIFIDMIITNNEERTVEQAAHRYLPELSLTQLKYFLVKEKDPKQILSAISLFNPNKEIAYIRRSGKVFRWNSDKKSEEPAMQSPLSAGIKLLRRDEPDTGAGSLGKGGESGVCYVCDGISEQKLYSKRVLELFANPHASTLERLA